MNKFRQKLSACEEEKYREQHGNTCKQRMHVVDSGAPLHMGLVSSSNKEKNTIRQSNTILDSQTVDGIYYGLGHASKGSHQGA